MCEQRPRFWWVACQPLASFCELGAIALLFDALLFELFYVFASILASVSTNLEHHRVDDEKKTILS